MTILFWLSMFELAIQPQQARVLLLALEVAYS